jgi:hypothetical protein
MRGCLEGYEVDLESAVGSPLHRTRAFELLHGPAHHLAHGSDGPGDVLLGQVEHRSLCLRPQDEVPGHPLSHGEEGRQVQLLDGGEVLA